MTTKLIELTQVDARATRQVQAAHQRGQFRTVDAFTDTDEPGENGNAPDQVAAAPEAAAAEQPGEVTRPVTVNVAAIRSFTARRDGEGTRLTFTDGGGYAVAESYDQVKVLIQAA
jgi:hypothetical protein